VVGPLPFDSSGSGSFIPTVDVLCVAQPSAVERLASFPELEVGLAMVDGELLSAVGGQGSFARAQLGVVLLDPATEERILLLVGGAKLAPIGADAKGGAQAAVRAVNVKDLMERVALVSRLERKRMFQA
jgi:hypothetical protein